MCSRPITRLPEAAGTQRHACSPEPCIMTAPHRVWSLLAIAVLAGMSRTVATSPKSLCIHPTRTPSYVKAVPNCKASPEAVVGHSAVKIGQLPVPVFACAGIQEVWVVHKFGPHLQGKGQQKVACASSCVNCRGQQRQPCTCCSAAPAM